MPLALTLSAPGWSQSAPASGAVARPAPATAAAGGEAGEDLGSCPPLSMAQIARIQRRQRVAVQGGGCLMVFNALR
ncbi:MAG: hypothetical protein VKI83_03430 [Synechococcaceae cyanobacterium]|nr:hypothetical protein [Synechococcaceae cyanobacterium]